jgi:hypothetical protein
VPPAIIRIQPDTNSVGVRGKDFVVQFDEVISERPANATTLSDVVLISPRSGEPNVDWHRSRITIHPDKGWKANTTYTVTLLPGITDLRGNVLMTPTVVTFSTGPSIPNTMLGGTIFDWLAGTPLSNGMVEARPLTDTTVVYVAATDSIGHYGMRGLPAAQYSIRGYADQNHNRGLDPSEIFDTTRVTLTDSLNLELLAFAHDSTGPHISNVVMNDSVTVQATFDPPLDPKIPVTASQFTVTGPDSARIAIASVTVTRPDTVRPAPPAARPVVPQSAIPIPQGQTAPVPVVLPKPTRPLLVRNLVITLGQPLRPGTTYRLNATDLTGPTGKKLSSEKTFDTPKPAPPPTDSAAAKKPAPAPAARPIRPER